MTSPYVYLVIHHYHCDYPRQRLHALFSSKEEAESYCSKYKTQKYGYFVVMELENGLDE